MRDGIRGHVFDTILSYLQHDLLTLTRLALASKELMQKVEPMVVALLVGAFRRFGRKGMTNDPKWKRYHLNLGFWAAPMGTYEDIKGNRVRSIVAPTQGMFREIAVLAQQDPRCRGFHPAGAAEGGIAWTPTVWEKAFNASMDGCEGAEPQIRTYGIGDYDSSLCWDTTLPMTATDRSEPVALEPNLFFGRTEVFCVHFWAKYGVSLDRMLGLLDAVKRAGWTIVAMNGMKEKDGGVWPVATRKNRGGIYGKKKLSELGADERTQRKKLCMRRIA